jgi:hypothetical protein
MHAVLNSGNKVGNNGIHGNIGNVDNIVIERDTTSSLPSIITSAKHE